MSSYNSSRLIRSGACSCDAGCPGAAASSGPGRGNVASTGRITRRLHSPPSFSCNTSSIKRSAIEVSSLPFPVPDLRHVLTVLGDVLLVLDQFVLELLLQVDALVAGLRQTVDHVHHQVEAVQVVQ